MSKIITAVFGQGQFTTAAKAFQWDVGDILRFEGLDLPESYEVHFANSTSGVAVTVPGDAEGVVIPSELFAYGDEIYAWIVLTENNGLHTEYQAMIPVHRRARPAGVLPPGPQGLSSISAQFSQGSAAIYDTDTLNTLRRYLAVVAEYYDGTSELVTDYTLTGTLAEGTSTITAAYNGKTDSFEVTVTHKDPYEVLDNVVF